MPLVRGLKWANLSLEWRTNYTQSNRINWETGHFGKRLKKMKTLKVVCNACFKSWWCWKRDKCFLQQNIPISAESDGESFDKKIKRER